VCGVPVSKSKQQSFEHRQQLLNSGNGSFLIYTVVIDQPDKTTTNEYRNMSAYENSGNYS